MLREEPSEGGEGGRRRGAARPRQARRGRRGEFRPRGEHCRAVRARSSRARGGPLRRRRRDAPSSPTWGARGRVSTRARTTVRADLDGTPGGGVDHYITASYQLSFCPPRSCPPGSRPGSCPGAPGARLGARPRAFPVRALAPFATRARSRRCARDLGRRGALRRRTLALRRSRRRRRRAAAAGLAVRLRLARDRRKPEILAPAGGWLQCARRWRRARTPFNSAVTG